LIALGLAEVDHQAHGAILLTEQSRAVLKGDLPVQMRRATQGRQRPPRSDRTSSTSLSGTEGRLLEQLKIWRREESRVQGVPAYVIFHDSTLAEIARRHPHDILALSGIGGVGAKKLERYGEALLAITAAYALDAT